jgi:hypothetical protein
MSKELFKTAGVEPKTQLIVGCMKYVDLIMHKTEFKDEEIDIIYKCARHVVYPVDELTRYDLPKAGLEILSDHILIFQRCVLKDYQYILPKINSLTTHKNKALYRLALLTLEAMLKCIAESLTEQTSEPNKQCCLFILNILNKKLDSNADESIKQISITLKCFSCFSRAAKLYWGEEKFLIFQARIFQEITKLYADQKTITDESIGYLPAFFTSIGYLVNSSNGSLNPKLIELAVYLIRIFLTYLPSTYWACKQSGAESCLHLFVALGFSPSLSPGLRALSQ